MADNEFEGEASDNESNTSFRGESECEGEDSGGEVPEQVIDGTTDERAATPKKGKAKRKKKKYGKPNSSQHNFIFLEQKNRFTECVVLSYFFVQMDECLFDKLQI